MDQWEALFLYVTIACYAISFTLFLASIVFGRELWLAYGMGAGVIGFAAHTLTIVFRGLATGHLPVMRDYENALAGGWTLVLIYVVVQDRFPATRAVGVAVYPFAMLMLGYGILTRPQLEPMSPAVQSWWLYVHVFFAWLAYSSLALAAGIAVLLLLKDRPKATSPLLRRLPSPKTMDELNYRLISFGFFTLAIMITAGAIWAADLWGSYWSWDPVETWSLISWLLYAIYLHVRLTYGWKGRRMAWLAIGALVTVIISFWGIRFVGGGLHVFNLM